MKRLSQTKPRPFIYLFLIVHLCLFVVKTVKILATVLTETQNCHGYSCVHIINAP
jgi:hypothetical protein